MAASAMTAPAMTASATAVNITPQFVDLTEEIARNATSLLKTKVLLVTPNG
jgi:hypothetical protein